MTRLARLETEVLRPLFSRAHAIIPVACAALLCNYPTYNLHRCQGSLEAVLQPLPGTLPEHGAESSAGGFPILLVDEE